MKNARRTQVGGNHYVGMSVQPLTFAYANRYDPILFAAMKYLLRHRAKNGAQDLDKAAHCCFLRAEHIAELGEFPEPLNAIPVQQVIFANKIPAPDRDVLMSLDAWSRESASVEAHRDTAAEIAHKLVALRNSFYPQGPTR